MNRVSALLVGIAALAAIPTIADAAQGCGRGMYYNGRRCVPQDDIGYRPHHRRYVEDDDIGYRRHHRPGVGVNVAPGIRLQPATTLDRGTTMTMMIKPSGEGHVGTLARGAVAAPSPRRSGTESPIDRVRPNRV